MLTAYANEIADTKFSGRYYRLIDKIKRNLDCERIVNMVIGGLK